MPYLDLVDDVSLFRSLFAIDEELAERARQGGCPHCEGPLHRAAYLRQPRGESVEVPDACKLRLSLCCGHCRRRTLPASVLYLGRRVYWGCVIVLVTGAVQGLESHSMRALCERFGVARRTIKRWLSYFSTILPTSERWQRARGRLSALVGNEGLPRTLLEWLFAQHDSLAEALLACLRLLAGDAALRGNKIGTQKMPSPM